MLAFLDPDTDDRHNWSGSRPGKTVINPWQPSGQQLAINSQYNIIFCCVFPSIVRVHVSFVLVFDKVIILALILTYVVALLFP